MLCTNAVSGSSQSRPRRARIEDPFLSSGLVHYGYLARGYSARNFRSDGTGASDDIGRYGGFSSLHWRRLERGERHMNLETLAGIARAFGTTLPVSFKAWARERTSRIGLARRHAPACG